MADDDNGGTQEIILSALHVIIGSPHHRNKVPFFLAPYHFHIFSSALKASLALTQVGFVYLEMSVYC